MKKIILLFIFLTTFISVNAQLSENFEDAAVPVSGNWALPSGTWKVFDNGVGTIQSWNGLSNVNFTYNFPGRSANVLREFVPAGATSEDWLVMPLKNIRANEQLRFFTRQGFLGNDGTLYQIRVSTNVDPTLQSAYTLLKSYTEDELIGPAPAIYNQYDEKIINLTGGTPNYFNQNIFIAFVKVYARPADASIPSAGDRWLIDNVQLAQKCFAPTDLFVTTTTTTAKLQWLPTAGNYEVQWAPFPLDITAPANTYLATSGNPTGLNILTGLTPNTKYQFRVRKICGPGITSEWSILFPFNTLNIGATCTEPIAFTTLPYSSSDDTLNFGDNLTQASPGATGCGTTAGYLGGTDVVYKYTVPLTGGPSQISIAMNPLGAVNTSVFVYGSCAAIGTNCLAGVANATSAIRTISPFNVTPGATYYIVISELVIPFSFNYILTVQAITCPPPTALSASDFTQFTADLNWTSPASTTSWQYEVQAVGSTNSNIPVGSGTITLDTGNPHVDNVVTYTLADGTFAPLVPGTNYQFWVRSKCGSTDTYSPWAGPYPFQTTQCPVADQCTYTFTMTDAQTLGAGWEGARMEIRQNGLVLATIGEQATGATATFTTKLCDDLPMELFWLNGGIHASEVGVIIKNSFGQLLHTTPFGSEALVGTVLYPVPTTPVTIKYAECDYPECQPPTGLATTAPADITINSAKVKWNVPSWMVAGYTYNVFVATAPFTTPNTPPVAVAPDSFYYPNATIIISGTGPNLIATFQIPAVLAQDTNYKFWVQINCSPNNGPSPWSAPVSFITKVACPKATALNVETTGTPALTILPTQAKVYWTTPATPPVTSWWVKAVPVLPPAPVVTPVFDPLTWTQVLTNPNNLANAFILGNGVLGSPNEPLQPDTDYNYYVVSDCNATGSGVSNIAGPKLFHTRPTCFRPTTPNVTAASITTTSATFTWTKGEATDVAWEILCVPKPDTTLQTEIPPVFPSYPQQLLFSVPAGSATIVGNNVTYALPVGSLVTAKIYNYFIRTVCSATDKSKWTLVKLFNTLPCNAVDKCNYKIVLTNLELPLPLDNDWFGARIQIRQNGIVVATVGNSGINSGIPIDVPMCPGVPFDLFWSIPGTQPQEISFTLYNPFSEQLFQYNASPQADPFVPYKIYVSPTGGSCTPIGCVLPQTQPVVAATVTAFNAVIDWTPNGSETQWEIVAMPLAIDAQPVDASPVQGTSTGVNVGGKIYYLASGLPHFIMTGLTPDTDYVYYIRSVCSLTNTSVWNLVPIPFKTKIACYQPATITLVPNSQTANSVSLWWTNNPLNIATAWDIIAVPTGTVPTGTSTPTGTWSGIIPNASTPYVLSGLIANTTYDIYVRTNCVGLNVGSDNYGTSKWTGLGTVTTDPNCYPPVNLAWINDNLNPAELTWSPNPNQVGNSQWTVYTQIYTGAVNLPTTGGTPVTTVLTPTPIQYNVKDSFGNISNNATIGIGLVDNLPIATNDTTNYASPVTINVIANDTTADVVLPATVSLIIPSGVTATGIVVNATNGNVTSMTIPNQGTWTVNALGVVTFTRLATFTGVPTPIQYNVEDQEGNQSNNATITFVTPTPIASNDSIFYTTGTIIIPVLANDTTGGTAVPSTVSLVPPATGVTGIVTDTNLDVTAMTITGEGTWTVNVTSGVITFTPIAGFTGFPSPIQYNIEDILAIPSNNATVTLSNVDVLPIAINDTQPLVAGANTITVLTNDNTGDTVVPARVSLIPPATGVTGIVSDAQLDITAMTITGQGTWSVNIVSGVITFTKLLAFTGVPTPIQYTVRDAQLNISNPATITLTSLLPIATNDSLPFTNNSIASVNVITNDTTGGVVVPATVSLIPPTGAIEVVTNTAVTPNIVTSFRVPNEGRWTLVNGVVTFTPILSWTTPASVGALAPGFYEFYVASNCGSNGASVLAGPQYFSIYADPVACAAISLDLGISTNNINVCADDNCTSITANYTDLFDTTSYEMLPVKYNPPFPFTGGPGATNLNITTDDLWSSVVPIKPNPPVPQSIPFNFCFFGDSKNSIQVGSNGLIVFNSNYVGTCQWNFQQMQIPNAGFIYKDAIYGVYQDIDPSVATAPLPHSINYGVIGTSPCRAFVVNFENITQFGGGNLVKGQTSQIVLYETSNIIEIYVEKRTPEISWLQGEGLLGIQNAAGDLAFVPPGKNTGPWSSIQEAFRFTPNGNSIVDFAWKDANGAVLTNNKTLNVCPTVTTTYTASGTYANCDGIVVPVDTPVTVNIHNPTVPVSSGDVTECIANPIQTLTAVALVENPIDPTIEAEETIIWYDINNNVVTSPTWNQTASTTYFAESAYIRNDYVDLPATTLTIPAGQTSASVSVSTITDSFVEGIENFFLKGNVISNNTTNTRAEAKGFIFDDATGPVTISVSSPVVTEGSIANFTISLSNPSPTPIVISYATTLIPGGASNSDFTNISGSITIPANTLFVNIPVITLIDTIIYELNESFTFSITVTSGSTLNATAAGIGTINESRSEPTLMISNQSVVEGNPAIFTFTLSKPSSLDTVITVSTNDGTAAIVDCRNPVKTPVKLTIHNPSTPISTGNINVCALNPIQTITADAFVNEDETIVWYDAANNIVASPTWNTVGSTTYFAESAYQSNDYSDLPAPTTVTIPAGATSATVTVNTTTDSIEEGTETFFIKGNVISTNTINTHVSGKANLTDDASQVVVSVSDLTVVEGSPAIFNVSLSNPSALDTTINVATANGSALSGSDYTALSTTLVTIPAGSLSVNVTVPTLTDTSAESENFKLNATVTSTNTINTTAFGTATISELSSLPTLMISNESVVEGATATFTFTLSKASTTPTIIDVKSVDGTAINIDCRGAVKTPVTLTLYDLPLPITGGDKKECETFPIVQTLTATATPATADLGVTWYDVATGGTLLTSAPTLNTVGEKTYYAESVVLNTDYTATEGTVTIPAGQTSAIVSVPVLTDTTVEPNETFYLNAAVTSTNTLNTNVVGTGLISGVSAKPIVYISKPTVVEGTNAIFDISLSKPSLLPTKINFVTSDGTANSGTDYTQLTQQLVIPAGSVTGSITVITSVDAIVDSGENFTLTGTVVSTNTANTSIAVTATITEIADLPTVIISNPIATEGNNAQFTITLSTPSTLPTVITYTTNPNTAGPGCVSPSRTPVKLEILAIPAIPTGTDQVECALTPLQTLTATANTTTAGASIVWYDSETGTTSVTPTWNSIGTKIYWAESVNSTTLCKSSSRKPVSLTIKALPLAPTTGAPQSVCSITPLQTLTAVATPPAGANLVWYDVASGGTPLTTAPIWNTVGQKSYFVESQEGIAPNICVSATRTEVKLEIRQSPAIPSTPAKQSVCATNPIQTLTPVATTTTPGATIVWYDALVGGNVVTDPKLGSLGTATFYAESQNSTTSCFSEARTKVELEILDLPKFTLFGNCIVKDFIIKVVPEANFDLTTATYIWKNSAGQVVSTASSYKATAVGNYTCEVTNTNTCSTTVSYNVISVSCTIQKGISPKGVNGGDGLNDYFDLEGLNVTKLQIFNRYGTAVYSKENYIKEWYGQSDAGNELSDGTYYYVIERNNEAPLTGWIYINREQ